MQIIADDLSGSGGSVSADGSTYYFARARGDAWGIGAMDLRDRSVRWIRQPERQFFHSGVRISPDGRHLAVVRSGLGGYRVAIVGAQTGEIVREIEADESTAVTPDWVDAESILFSASSGGRMQVHVATIRGTGTTVVSRAPYLAFAPQAHGNAIRFLNRQGWDWSLDEIPRPLDPVADDRVPLPAPHVASLASDLPATHATVVRDKPYSGFERLFIPTMHSPWLAVRSRSGTVVGVGASGGDVLGWNRWALNLGFNIPGRLLSGEAQYVNGKLGPVSLIAAGGHYATREQRTVDGKPEDILDTTTGRPIDQRETALMLGLSRTFFEGTTVATGFRFDSLVRTLDNHGADLDDRRFGGYFASLAYAAAERTPYTGIRRGVAASLTGTMFPQAWESFPVGDGRASLAVTHQLGLRRLIGGLAVAGRYLAGAPSGYSLLQIGGSSPVAPQFRDATGGPPLGNDISGLLPPGLRFVEALAGFEDRAIYDRGAALGEVSIRYPLIADWGSMSTFYVLPSFLFRQLDLVAFADGARLADAGRVAAAAGGRAVARVALWLLPISLQAQLARRLTDDEKLAFYFSLLLE